MKLPIDSRQLRAFIVLARTGSFTRAGKELFLSQSAVSHSMRSLEKDLGCLLLDRVGKKVILTQAGEHLLHHAEKILKEMNAARQDLARLGKWGQARLRLGASTTACEHILPPVLRAFKDSFPQCSITIRPGDADKAIDLLRSNEIDLALALQPDEELGIEFIPLFTDELYFLVAPGHPWAIKEKVQRDELRFENFIIYNKGSYTFRLIQKYFQEEEIVLNTIIELGSMEAIKELIKLGLGVSVLAPWIAQKELEDKSLVMLPLGRRKLKRNWGLLHRQKQRLGLPEESFINQCRTFTAQFLKKNEASLETKQAGLQTEETLLTKTNQNAQALL